MYEKISSKYFIQLRSKNSNQNNCLKVDLHVRYTFIFTALCIVDFDNMHISVSAYFDVIMMSLHGFREVENRNRFDTISF